ncbi:hypothetical protein C5167_018368 [Papaver somniferum]|uniref:VWFA domain-containing protein n=1 Tax=Papaver somniferum TaxID=3469 RepID=A0A4Y7IR30_PAPSO|nr:hypothetical protein C5167_018368 [Papaver somniferum]
MKKYKKLFMKHDEERFKKYLESVKRGDAKIAAAELLPCDIYEGTGCFVAELQWQRMVNDLLEKGKLKDCLAICDVSGSMVGPPLQASLALGLLISEISEDPWKGKLITFNNHSQLQEIKAMIFALRECSSKVFDTILQVVIDGNLKEDQVIKRVFVFSDMRFDKASKNYFEWAADHPTLDTAFSWETDYETIKRMFRESGYMSVPEIVFWNLRSSGATPVTWEQKDGGDLNGLTPISVMKKAISGEEYDKLVTTPSNDHTTASNPFIDLMEKNFNKPLKPPSGMYLHGYTENGSPTYLSSGNPLLDFFFHVVPDTPSDRVIKRLELAWECDPLKALKLICNLRGVRGTGKSEKEGFYAAALWLFKHHPKTLAVNVKSFAEFGYFKDLPEILQRITEEGEEEEMEICVTKRKMCCTFKTWEKEWPFIQKIPQEDRIQEDIKRGQLVKEKTEHVARRKENQEGGKSNQQVFAEYLVADMKILNEGQSFGISFAANIARRIFTRESYPEYENIDEAHYAYRIRDRLRKEVLVPLHKALELPELYMSLNKWELLPYNRVPSVAMNNYKEVFMNHEKERFTNHLEGVQRGDKKYKIATGALLPHQIIESLEYEEDNDCNVPEFEWKRMVEDLSKVGKLKDCFAIADVSGSMTGTPMDVVVALGKLITFSDNPELQTIEGDTLRSKTEFIKKMQWGFSTDFQKVFDQILQVAVEGNLKEDQMIKRLFVFSDVEFNQANNGKYSPYDYNYDRQSADAEWETDYEVIQNKFREKEYMNVPEIIFWNLRESHSTPLLCQQKGVAMVSGFSKNMVKVFLDQDSDFSQFTPLGVMEKAISGEEYNKLVLSSSVIQLIGPPEIYQTPFIPKLPPQQQTPPPQTTPSNNLTTAPDPFIDLMEKNFNKPLKPSTDIYSLYGYTENKSPTYLSSGNPLLDFFFHVVPDTPSESVIKRLELAWEYDPLKALKLICNLRGVTGTGKSDKQGFYAAALWLFKHHPKTLDANVKSFAEVGYFKDLPEILQRITEEGHKEEDEEEEKQIWVTKRKMCCTFKTWKKEWVFIQKKNTTRRQDTRRYKERSIGERKNEYVARRKETQEGEKSDREILEAFAEYLVADLKILNEGKTYGISFAAKWCPSLYLCYDQSTLLCESIARRIFTRESYPEYENVDEAHYAYRIRDRLRKEVLVPLHKALELPELYMSSNKWELLPYNRVPSNFTNHLEGVKRGDKKCKIAAGALLPHQIIKSLRFEDENDCNVPELQWKRMVEDLSKIGKLKDCLAIADVSGSMTGTPMDVVVSLGLLVSEMSHEPWKGKRITFSENPELHKIEGDTLRSKTEFIRQMQWGYSTDFQKVFDQILRVAVEGNLKEDQMIKRLFVFSDMEFNQANSKGKYSPYHYYYGRQSADAEWETDYQVIQNKFREKGYRNVPEIIFWNLRESHSTPVLSQQKGVAMVGGFSKNMMKVFLEDPYFSEFTPFSVMEKAISGEEYNKLVVVD